MACDKKLTLTLATLVAAILGFLAGGYVYEVSGDRVWAEPANIIYSYQTLIAGGLALFGAFLTIRKMQAQIENARADSDRARRAGMVGVNLPIVARIGQLDNDAAAASVELLISTFTSPRDGQVEPMEVPHSFKISTDLDIDIRGVRAISMAKVVATTAYREYVSARAVGKPGYEDLLEPARETLRQYQNVLRDATACLLAGDSVHDLRSLTMVGLHERRLKLP